MRTPVSFSAVGLSLCPAYLLLAPIWPHGWSVRGVAMPLQNYADCHLELSLHQVQRRSLSPTYLVCVCINQRRILGRLTGCILSCNAYTADTLLLSLRAHLPGRAKHLCQNGLLRIRCGRRIRTWDSKNSLQRLSIWFLLMIQWPWKSFSLVSDTLKKKQYRVI